MASFRAASRELLGSLAALKCHRKDERFRAAIAKTYWAIIRARDGSSLN
jgi:hypothetical protein